MRCHNQSTKRKGCQQRIPYPLKCLSKIEYKLAHSKVNKNREDLLLPGFHTRNSKGNYSSEYERPLDVDFVPHKEINDQEQQISQQICKYTV